MLIAQEAISIPIAYIETFVMTFVSFGIGYLGAVFYARARINRTTTTHKHEIKKLTNRINDLQMELDRTTGNTPAKDRMDQDIEQVKFQRRAFSEEVLDEKVVQKETTEINFSRIGKASEAQRDDLQQVVGIGPYTEAKLNELGIYTFNQISKFTDDDISVITKLIKFFPDRIKNDHWVAKARSLKENPPVEVKQMR